MHAVARWTLGWLALWALWLLFQGEWNAIEIYAAASAATLSILIALLIRRFALPSARVEWRWLRRAARIPWLVLKEFWMITRSLFERGEGEFRRLDFPAGGARPAERGRRAFIAVATGYSPNSYILDVDEDRGEVLVHVLRRVPRGEELT